MHDRRRSAGDRPLVTVLTVVYNAGAAIEKTVLSVLPFLGDEVEYVVIDGGSNDDTLAYLGRYSGHYSEFVSEPDSGIYDAMNKGAQLAKGDFIIHLNAGDCLTDLPLALLRRQPEHIAAVACCVTVNGLDAFQPAVGWVLKTHNTIHHQGCFYRRNLMPEYDIRYRVFADFDLNLRLFLSGAVILIDSCRVATHESDGVSNRTSRFSEVYQIIKARCGLHWLLISWCYFKWRGLRSRLAAYG